MTNVFTRKNVKLLIFLFVLVVLGYFILPVSIPLIAAFVTSLLLLPGVKLLTRRIKLTYQLAVMAVFSLFLLVVGLVTYCLAIIVGTQGTQFAENLPRYINDLNSAWLSFQHSLSNNESIPPDFVRAVNQEVTRTLNNIGTSIADLNVISRAASVISSIPGYLVSFLVYVIALFLFLLEMPRLKTILFSYFTEKTKEQVNFMTARLSYVVFGFLKAQFIVSIFIFLVSLIGLLFIAPEVALLMSLIIWIIDFVPIIGSIAVLAPWAIFQFIAGDASTGTQLLILAGVLLVIRRTVEPKVMGTHIGLSPLATLISMYLGLMLFGVIGFVVGPLILIAFTSAREAGIIKMNFKI
ncbi:sporulation integral membrane protein YtvI [Shouchella shacheensis]|uniref:sporulation integral membrane protein YtvI n=1 Tax=Shouchella shacheensis TaxID=1649580 RepID=UPI0007403D69|nr:sporulation integral membrane protein YtvI [Shouchella shacheensis]